VGLRKLSGERHFLKAEQILKLAEVTLIASTVIQTGLTKRQVEKGWSG